MGVFDKVGDTLSSVSKDMVTKAKSSSDASKIKQQVLYEEERIADFYNQLGKAYFVEKPLNPSDLYLKLCEEIQTRSARVERLKLQINDLKGIKVCKNCGSVVNNNFSFCGICGAKLPEVFAESESEASSAPIAHDGSLAFSGK